MSSAPHPGPSTPASRLMALLCQITARGEWPFALLYRLHHTLQSLLAEVGSNLKAISTKVACPACGGAAVELAAVEEGHPVLCPDRCTAGSPALDVSGFRCWGIDAAVTDAREAVLGAGLQRHRGWQERVRHAVDTLVDWSLPKFDAPAMPVLWAAKRGKMLGQELRVEEGETVSS